MATNSDSAFRIKMIISLFVIVTLLYTSYSVFNPSYIDTTITPDAVSNYTASDGSGVQYNLSDTSEIEGEGSDFIGLIFGLGSFLTFGVIDNSWARLFLNAVNTICFIGIGYTIYLFIRDWIPFV